MASVEIPNDQIGHAAYYHVVAAKLASIGVEYHVGGSVSTFTVADQSPDGPPIHPPDDPSEPEEKEPDNAV